MSTTAEKIAIMQAFLDGQPVEFKTLLNHHWHPLDCKEPGWDWSNLNYRIKPMIPDFIDWSQVDPAFNFIARSKRGYIYLFKMRPRIPPKGNFWAASDSIINCIGGPNFNLFSSFKLGDTPWDQSLIERPTS